jgi:uncharacterized membrane protein YvlD (DUF360 family)
VLLPVFTILVAPVLAVASGIFQVVPPAFAVLLEIVAALLAAKLRVSTIGLKSYNRPPSCLTYFAQMMNLD